MNYANLITEPDKDVDDHTHDLKCLSPFRDNSNTPKKMERKVSIEQTMLIIAENYNSIVLPRDPTNINEDLNESLGTDNSSIVTKKIINKGKNSSNTYNRFPSIRITTDQNIEGSI